MSAEAIVVQLSVVNVQSGGNAGRGQYFYSFDQDVILVEKANTVMEFSLSADTPEQFSIRSVVSSDATEQLIDFKFSKDARTVTLLNTCKSPTLITLALLVWDKKSQRNVLCDPQVINSPERPPIE
jgi:hypothetical protein